MPKIMPEAYAGPQDLESLLSAQAGWASTGASGGLHPGEIQYRLSNALREVAPEEALWLCRDKHGEMLAWVLFYRRFVAFDWDLRPDLRGSPTEQDLLDWIEATLGAWMRADNNTLRPFNTDVHLSEPVRLQSLQARGYQMLKAAFFVTMRDLSLQLPAPSLPEGFAIRPARLADAPALARVHAAAFGSSWTPESYATFMQSPLYQPQQEQVVVAPDGQIVCFLIMWMDARNKTGLIEPVGTDPAFQRRGLARALLLHSLASMRDAGMTHARISFAQDKPALAALYHSLGFETMDALHSYYKMMPFGLG